VVLAGDDVTQHPIAPFGAYPIDHLRLPAPVAFDTRDQLGNAANGSRAHDGLDEALVNAADTSIAMEHN
jgi:hypothetical protein